MKQEALRWFGNYRTHGRLVTVSRANSMGNEAAIETLDLVHEGLTIENA